MVKKKTDKKNVSEENKDRGEEDQGKVLQETRTISEEKMTGKKTITKKQNDSRAEESSPADTTKNDKSKQGKKEIERKPVLKYIPKVKKENKSKSKEAREAQKKISKKKSKPVFRGRFGKKNIRRKSIAKWDKWRKPRGIDLDKGLQHGFRPKIGYRNQKEIRGLHPSGYFEILVCNENDLEKINPKINAARLSSRLGKRKRNEIIKKANEKGIWVLN